MEMLRLVFLFSVTTALVTLSSFGNCMFQENFYDIDQNDVDEVVLDFATNREKFKAFGCRMLVDKESSAVDPHYADDDSHSEYRFCVFEDGKSKNYRADWQRLNLFDSLPHPSSWGTLYKPSGKRKMFLRGLELNGNQLSSISELFFLPPDPWCATITDQMSIEKNREEPLHWMFLFDRKKLLWAQESSRFLRAEWNVGIESRMQVYFDRQKENLPVYCRYSIPANKDEKFGKKAKRYINEIETKWQKIGDGWVPTKVTNNREMQ
jgi:hypothetical protein